MFNTVLDRNFNQIVDDFRRSVDQFFSDFYRTAQPATGVTGGDYAFTPAVETGWNDQNDLFLRVVLPGVSDKDVNVTLQNDQLVIEGERKAPEWSKTANRQLAYGKFYAAVALPKELDTERLSCRMHDGVLDVQAPLAESMKPRQIPIEAGRTQQALAA